MFCLVNFLFATAVFAAGAGLTVATLMAMNETYHTPKPAPITVWVNLSATLLHGLVAMYVVALIYIVPRVVVAKICEHLRSQGGPQPGDKMLV